MLNAVVVDNVQKIQDEVAALRQENSDLHATNALLRQEVAEARLAADAISRQSAACRQSAARRPWSGAFLRHGVRRLWRRLRPVSGMRPTIGVFLHLYYADLAVEFAAAIARVPEPKRLYISTDTAEKAASIAQAFAAGGETRADIRVFPNRGFDIGPFLVGFREEIGRQDLVLRLHGKKSTQLGDAAGAAWRRQLVDALLGDTERIQAILRAFRSRPDLGMVYPEHWAGLYRLYDAPIAIGSNLVTMAKLLDRYAVPLPAHFPIEFPSGSMFWCRPRALAPWMRFDFSWDSFEESREEARDASLAHALERLFLFGCGLEGMTWARADAMPRPEAGEDASSVRMDFSLKKTR